ncbi:MAG: hypothetical protein FJ144_13020 [Deltaproteobacteria bacterium]|nr:hypothetical protein [Deltaproteobacteria bacterium]
MKSPLRLVFGIVAGCLGAAVVAGVGFFALRTFWSGYAEAEPEKAYSLGMLLARLTVGALCAAGVAITATIVARDGGRAAWWFGALFLLLSLRPHLYTVWDDYPVWYHFVYLGYLVPIAGFTGRFAARRLSVGT